jgi:hypothetical protein
MRMDNIKKISCEIHARKGWVILFDKKLLGFVWKLDDGDFKYGYECYSEYGPSGYHNSIDKAILYMIESGYF